VDMSGAVISVFVFRWRWDRKNPEAERQVE